MKCHLKPLPLWITLLATMLAVGHAGAQSGTSNAPPKVSLVWPSYVHILTGEPLLRLRADVTPGGHPVAFVQFFAETNLIATVTNPPYAAMWWLAPPRWAYSWPFALTAAAVDTAGLRAESCPVHLFWNGNPPLLPVVEVTSPQADAIFAAPAAFLFGAELLASAGDAGPVEFFVGTNSVGTVTQADTNFTVATPPYSATVTNLPAGTYQLEVRYYGKSGIGLTYGSRTIRVTNLGIQSPGLTSDGRVQFGVVTSFPGESTVIESSPDLATWSPIATNVPPGNAFTFVDPSPATNAARFYRAVIPSQ